MNTASLVPATNNYDALTANFLSVKGFNVEQQWHYYGCMCDLCQRHYYGPITISYLPVVPQDQAEMLERMAADSVIDALRKQKNLTQETRDALSVLDGIRKLRGMP